MQVKNQQGQWISADPIPGTFVCNIGDMLKVQYKSSCCDRGRTHAILHLITFSRPGSRQYCCWACMLSLQIDKHQITRSDISRAFRCSKEGLIALQVWSNGLYKPTPHRVINADPSESRVSIPFFYEPCYEAIVEPPIALVNKLGTR